MFKVLGFEEAINACDCCGKTNLKGTFAVEREDGETLYFGSVCVTRHTGRDAKAVRKEAKDATQERLNRASTEFNSHPAELAYRAKLKESRKAGLTGAAFRDANRVEWEAAEAARFEIAGRYGFRPYQI